MPETAAIEVQGLGKRYQRPRPLRELLRGAPVPAPVQALQDISLRVGQGEVLGLLGANGAGKTTLINILCTLLAPSEGSARIGGHDVQQAPQQARAQVGLVTSNERSFYWRLSGRQNLRFFAELYRVPPREIEPRIDEFVQALGLAEFADRRFDGYSTGIRQRFAFARALLHHPRILFMDEPTKGLDPNASAQLLAVIRERIVAVWRPTIVLTSHNLSEIERLCERVAIVDHGRLLRIGTIGELARSIRSHQAYLLRLARVDAALLAWLRSWLGTERVRPLPPDDEQPGQALELGLAQGGPTLTELLSALIHRGQQILRCEPVDVSLEEVFRQTVREAAPPLPTDAARLKVAA
ncbi:ABC transporter ATP-binding protein [Aquincola tertiaricarbonis]|uniref:ABC transporter ATP-binding protein n=1 Tax=Aquincola tertiaricarbonis TaxID=391953 RepID=A0ABY4SHF7_AQUTE|nr:ABC transporter ATP-binding protein [Aquincola tertiaricarbonis]URI11567.1 ABC transporter ATP-binding protein [Aquincola tertiaricarbonis]